MTTRNAFPLALIGFGEVGRTFARALLARGDVRVAAWDIAFVGAAGPARASEAEAAGVRVARGAADAGRGARVVISAVTAAAAENVAGEAAAYLRPGQIFFDVNSASPATKRRAAAAVAACGADYVEGAVMAPVLGPGLRVPILAGGPAAVDLAALLSAIGMNVTSVTTEAGRASAMKLCRSIVIKGLEAALIDCAAAARGWGVEREVFDSLHGTFPSIAWPELARAMAERVGRHGVRRAMEMREAADMLADLGMDPVLCRAVADRHERIAADAAARAAAKD